jgi:hypothetical protein
LLKEFKDGGVWGGGGGGGGGGAGAPARPPPPPPAAAEIKRWSAARKRQVVLRMVRGESIDALSRKSGSIA